MAVNSDPGVGGAASSAVGDPCVLDNFPDSEVARVSGVWAGFAAGRRDDPPMAEEPAEQAGFHLWILC